MNTIDWLTPSIGVVAEYFDFVWIRTLEYDQRQGWVEAPDHKAEADNLVPRFEFRHDGQWRSVSGYCSFGISGASIDEDGRQWLTHTQPENVMWGPTYFLNWKETFIQVPRGFNAIRLWGRTKSHFYIYAQTYSLNNMLAPGVIRDPVTGVQIYPPLP